MLKLDQIQNNITSAAETMQQSMSQPSTSVSDLTEVLEQPCTTVEELEELCDKLKDIYCDMLFKYFIYRFYFSQVVI